MSLQAETTRAQYVGNGVTVSFAIPFVFHANDHVVVYKETIATGELATLEIVTDYILDGLSDPEGGTLLLYGDPITSDYRITVARIVPYSQLTDYVNNDAFVADAHERQMDLIVMMAQQLAAKQTINFPAGELIAANTTLSDPVTRAGKLIYFNATTGVLEEISITDLKALLDAL